MEIKVIDNFVSGVYQDHLENLIINAKLPIYYNLNTVEKEAIFDGKESSQFTHTFIYESQTNSPFLSHIEPIIFNFVAITEVLRSKKLVKCKLNFNYKDVSYAENEHFPSHVDAKKNGITAIYYVNNSDGDTLFFDKNRKVIESVSPKKGRIVYFNNQILHAGQPPKQSPYRAVINFNWIENDTELRTC